MIFNERTNTLLYKNIPLPLYSRKGWCWLCVRGELEWGQTASSSSDHSSTSFAFWLGCSTVGHWGPSPLSGAGSHSAGILLQLELDGVYVLVIFFFDTHLLPGGVRICHHHRIQPRSQVKVIFRYLRPDAPVSQFFRLFTQVHLWPKPKWIKHVAELVGSTQSSGWNVTLYLQFKNPFCFTQLVTFPFKMFWGRFNQKKTTI